MEINLSVVRVIVLAALLCGFAAFGGFDLLANSEMRMKRGIFSCILLFVTGAASATVVDHYVGNLERLNLRPLYILGGIILMGASALWIFSLKQALAAGNA